MGRLRYAWNDLHVQVYDPSRLHVIQHILDRSLRARIRKAVVRAGTLDPRYEVLAVPPTILTYDPLVSEGLCILEGHNRAFEAARRKVGLEGYLVEADYDMRRVPPECFGPQTNREWVTRNLFGVKHFRDQYQAIGCDTVPTMRYPSVLAYLSGRLRERFSASRQ